MDFSQYCCFALCCAKIETEREVWNKENPVLDTVDKYMMSLVADGLAG